jgi:hypothetical protein
LTHEEFKEKEEEFKFEEPMAKIAHEPTTIVRRPMKHAFIPQNLDQPSCIAYQPEVQGTFNLSPHILNTFTHF